MNITIDDLNALEKLVEDIGHKLLTQDNQITAEPMFTVQQRKRLYGFDASWRDFETVWLHQDGEEADAEEAASLEARYQGDGADGGETEIDCHERVGYMDIWETVTVCFTQAQADLYIKEQAHNLTDPRVYVNTFNRNREMIAIRAFLLCLAEKNHVKEEA